MTTAQVVETSVTVNNNSPIQDYVHPDDQTQPIEKNLQSETYFNNVGLFSLNCKLTWTQHLFSHDQFA